jgi:hypothetical protein
VVEKFSKWAVSWFVLYAIYRVSIKSFSDYKHLLQGNYVKYKHIFFTITVHAQSMFCDHFLFKFVSFFVWLFQFILFHFLTSFVICLCIFRSFTSVARVIFTRNSVHARVHLRWPALLFVSELFQCSLHFVFFAICSLAMIAFNFNVLRIAFHIKSLSASVTRADHPASQENSMMSSHALS